MSIAKYLAPAFNLSLRSIFHLFISGSLFFFFKSHFNMTLHFGVIAAFATGLFNEIIEQVRKVENSFHTKEVFKRDRWLAALALFYTTVIVWLHLLLATLLAPVSLLALTSYMDHRQIIIKTGRRNLIKPFADIAALTLGPIACIFLLSFLKIKTV